MKQYRMNKLREDRQALIDVKEVFPQAKRAWFIGVCDSCGLHGLSFWIDGDRSLDGEGYIDGGFYCVTCGFGNAGKIKVDELLR